MGFIRLQNFIGVKTFRLYITARHSLIMNYQITTCKSIKSNQRVIKSSIKLRNINYNKGADCGAYINVLTRVQMFETVLLRFKITSIKLVNNFQQTSYFQAEARVRIC